MLFYISALILAIVLTIKIVSKLTAGKCTSPVCLLGKTALVTGGNSGVGFYVASALAGRGCRVIIADKDNSDEARENIIQNTGNKNIISKQFDLSSLQSVRQLAKEINNEEERLDILVNNAVSSGLGNSYTEDGLHAGMQVNHFGPFLLTHLLVGLLKRSAPSRILFLTTVDAYIANIASKDLNLPKDNQHTIWSEFMVYANSKLCNIVVSNGFAQKLKGTGVTSNSVHPGLVHTNVFRNGINGLQCAQWRKELYYLLYQLILRPFGKAPEVAADAVLYPAIAKQLENVTGKFFGDCQALPMPSKAQDKSYSKEVWEISEKLVKLTATEKL